MLASPSPKSTIEPAKTNAPNNSKDESAPSSPKSDIEHGKPIGCYGRCEEQRHERVLKHEKKRQAKIDKMQTALNKLKEDENILIKLKVDENELPKSGCYGSCEIQRKKKTPKTEEVRSKIEKKEAKMQAKIDKMQKTLNKLIADEKALHERRVEKSVGCFGFSRSKSTKKSSSEDTKKTEKSHGCVGCKKNRKKSQAAQDNENVFSEIDKVKSLLNQHLVPGGSWIQTARNFEIIDNTLKSELKKDNGDWVKAEVPVYPDAKFKNVDGKFVKDTSDDATGSNKKISNSTIYLFIAQVHELNEVDFSVLNGNNAAINQMKKNVAKLTKDFKSEEFNRVNPDTMKETKNILQSVTAKINAIPQGSESPAETKKEEKSNKCCPRKKQEDGEQKSGCCPRKKTSQGDANSHGTLGGSGGLGPAWTRGNIEKPAGEKNMGSYTTAVYTPEQQQRLGVDEQGKPKKETHKGCCGTKSANEKSQNEEKKSGCFGAKKKDTIGSREEKCENEERSSGCCGKKAAKKKTTTEEKPTPAEPKPAEPTTVSP